MAKHRAVPRHLEKCCTWRKAKLDRADGDSSRCAQHGAIAFCAQAPRGRPAQKATPPARYGATPPGATPPRTGDTIAHKHCTCDTHAPNKHANQHQKQKQDQKQGLTRGLSGLTRPSGTHATNNSSGASSSSGTTTTNSSSSSSATGPATRAQWSCSWRSTASARNDAAQQRHAARRGGGLRAEHLPPSHPRPSRGGDSSARAAGARGQRHYQRQQ